MSLDVAASSHSPAMRLVAGALLLSLAGCASPVAPVNVASVPPAASVTPEGANPQTIVPVTLNGMASFKGEPLAAYELQVLDALTDKPLPLVPAPTVDGLQVIAPTGTALTTDKEGRFSLQVSGLKPGTALRLVASHGSVAVAAVFNGSLLAKSYRITEAGPGLAINEVTTAVSSLLGGLLRTARILTPQASAPILDQLFSNAPRLSERLQGELARNPGFANGIVNSSGADSEGSLSAALGNAGLTQEMAGLVASAISDIAQSAQQAGNRASDIGQPGVQSTLLTIPFTGTALRASFDPGKGALTLLNKLTGASIDGANAKGSSVATTTSTGGSSSSGSSVTPDDEGEEDGDVCFLE